MCRHMEGMTRRYQNADQVFGRLPAPSFQPGPEERTATRQAPAHGAHGPPQARAASSCVLPSRWQSTIGRRYLAGSRFNSP